MLTRRVAGDGSDTVAAVGFSCGIGHVIGRLFERRGTVPGVTNQLTSFIAECGLAARRGRAQ